MPVDVSAHIPTVDLGACGLDDVTEALVEHACVFVVGHGVAQRLRDEISQISSTFFDLPDETKAPVRWPGDGLWRGWLPEDCFPRAADRVPDLIQKFEIQAPDTFDLWPDGPAGFRTTWCSYYEACSDLAVRLIANIAGTLDLPDADLAAWTTEHFANLVVNDYPAPISAVPAGQYRLSAHSDRGGITLLAADDAPGGLEVWQPGNEQWGAVVIPPDAYLVQAGDMLARWTNRLIQANLHRVATPPAEVAAQARRQSIVYFHYPTLDAVVHPAPSCVRRTGSAPLPAINAQQHIENRQVAYGLVAEDRHGIYDDLDGRSVALR